MTCEIAEIHNRTRMEHTQKCADNNYSNKKNIFIIFYDLEAN